MPSLEFRRGLFRSEEHTSELQSHDNLVCRILLEKKNGLDKTAYDVASTVASSRNGCNFTATGSLTQSYAHFNQVFFFFFFNDTATTEIYILSPHAALPI